jgi:hypothetical protein
LVVDKRSPFSPALVFLVGDSRFLEWPHVEKDNKLCLSPPQAAHVVEVGTRLTEFLLAEAGRLIAACAAGQNREDFVKEFQSYWNRVTTPGMSGFWSILQLTPPTRSVSYSKQLGHILLAESPEDGARWVRMFTEKQSENQDAFKPCLYLWLRRPLYPDEYPMTNADIGSLVQRDADAGRLLAKFCRDEPVELPIAIAFDTENGPAIAGAILTRPQVYNFSRRSERSPLVDGFRKHKVPQSIVRGRYLSAGEKTKRLAVERSDRAWIHSRGGTGYEPRLKELRVGLIGCGSLGGFVADHLAKSGVGELLLLDPDKLSWGNVGRHLLGGRGRVGHNKAEGLRDMLQGSFPELSIEASRKDWEEFFEEEPEKLRSCDLLVSTTGSWPSESALNFLGRADTTFPNILFGWLEPHAVAGHALFVHEIGGCLACGMDSSGHFSRTAVLWPGGPQMVQEPGCGGFFQPYGSTDLAPAAALVGRTALEVLLGELSRSAHRVWRIEEKRIQDLGGILNYPLFSQDPAQGGCVSETEWEIDPSCQLCAKRE